MGYRYVDAGCGKIYLCQHCAETYQEKKSRKLISLIIALEKRFPGLEIAHTVLTIPPGHRWCQNEGGHAYSELMRTARDTIDIAYPGCGHVLILHTWSSRNPTEQNLHVHCLTILVNSKGQKVRGYSNVDYLREVWQMNINWHSKIDIHCEYRGFRQLYKIKHWIRYGLRSPIQDWCKRYEQPLTESYLLRVEPLFRVHRFRYTGWLSPRRRTKFLSSQGIVELNSSDASDWQFMQSFCSHSVWRDDTINMKIGFDIHRSELSDAISVCPKSYYMFYDDN